MGKESTCQCRKHGFNPQVWKMPWRRKWQPIPLFLPGKSHGQRSPGGLQSMGSQRVRHSLATKQQQHKPEAGSWEPWSPPEFPDSLQHRAEAQGFSPGLSDPFHSRLCFSTHLIPGCVRWAWLCQMLLRPWAGESVGAECSRPGKAVFFLRSALPPPPRSHAPRGSRGPSAINTQFWKPEGS